MSNANNQIDHSQIHKLARGIVSRYSSAIDFADKRFVCIPIDVIESYWEIESVRTLLAGLIEGTIDPSDFQKTSEQLIDKLWHLIDHLKDLDVALKHFDETI